MGKLQLSLAVTANDRTQPLIDGAVQPEGIELTVTVAGAGEIFWRQLRFQEFDASEMSLSETLMLASRGERSWAMLPVFTTRRFFHTGILVRVDAGIDQPKDLRGKRVGVPEYVQTAALWTRGVLQHEFGVLPEELDWYQERTERLSHGGAFGFRPAKGRFQYIPEEKDIGTMLVAGELDAALLYSGRPSLVDRSRIDLRRHPAVRPLFPDPRAEGLRYYRQTGLFPMNHGVVVRRAIVDRHPWVALNLYQAFVAAKELAAARARELADLHASLGWLTPEGRAAFDRDPLPYGVRSNRQALETCARYSHEQGLSPRLVALEEVFAAPTLEL
jgi:4,5-dihydroxyphthalate decarboxylase